MTSELDTRSTTVGQRGWMVLVISTAAVCLGILLSATGSATAGSEGLTLEDAVDGLMLLGFPLVGALLLHRSIAPRLAWLLLAVGAAVGASFMAGGWSSHALPGRNIAALLAEVGFVVVVSLLLTFLLLRLPNGSLPSTKWRWVERASAAVLALALFSIVFAPGPIDEDAPQGPTNPLGIDAAAPLIDVIEPIALLGFVALVLLSLASLLLRVVRGDSTTRRQVGVIACGAGVLVVLFLLDSTLQAWGGDLYGVLAAVVALGALPTSIGLALLRPADRRTSPIPSR